MKFNAKVMEKFFDFRGLRKNLSDIIFFFLFVRKTKGTSQIIYTEHFIADLNIRYLILHWIILKHFHSSTFHIRIFHSLKKKKYYFYVFYFLYYFLAVRLFTRLCKILKFYNTKTNSCI